jgi:hypothetical protein
VVELRLLTWVARKVLRLRVLLVAHWVLQVLMPQLVQLLLVLVRGLVTLPPQQAQDHF